MTFSTLNCFVPEIVHRRALKQDHEKQDCRGDDEEVEDEVCGGSVEWNAEDAKVHGEDREFGKGDSDSISSGEEYQ
jgi:hypothetical protein